MSRALDIYLYSSLEIKKYRNSIRITVFFLAERGGFEPPVRYSRTPAFQASTLDHSDTSPWSFSQIIFKKFVRGLLYHILLKIQEKFISPSVSKFPVFPSVFVSLLPILKPRTAENELHGKAQTPGRKIALVSNSQPPCP